MAEVPKANAPKARVPKARAVVGQSGGPTGVINASLVGVIEEAGRHAEIENLYGAVHGVQGIVNEAFIDLQAISKAELEAVAAVTMHKITPIAPYTPSHHHIVVTSITTT